MTITRRIIGIDPGLTGGAAFITDEKLCKWLGSPVEGIVVASEIGAKVFLENVHAFPGQGSTSTFNFGRAFGLVLGAAEALKVDIVLVSPQRWQTALLERPEGMSTKEAAMKFVEKTFGLDGFTVGRSRKPHSGYVDAACIAYWGLMYGETYTPPAPKKKLKLISF